MGQKNDKNQIPKQPNKRTTNDLLNADDITALLAACRTAGFGRTPVLTWAWPVCIDSLLVSGSLLILRNSLRQESTRFGWLVLSVFTLVSILFNVAVSPSNLLSQASHAIPPITLMVSVEILLSIVRSDLSSSEKTREKVADVTLPVPLVYRTGVSGGWRRWKRPEMIRSSTGCLPAGLMTVKSRTPVRSPGHSSIVKRC